MDTPEIEAALHWGAERRAQAERIIRTLDLMGRWAPYGQTVVVGAVAHGLVGKPDVDLEVYCERPRIEDGFSVVSALAMVPGIWKVHFSNELDGPDCGLYWQLRYRDPASTAGEVWKVDMWLLGHDCPGPVARDLIEPMRSALTDETRAAILAIKRDTLAEPDVHGIDVYPAVMDHGVRTTAHFRDWLSMHRATGLTRWRPGADLS